MQLVNASEQNFLTTDGKFDNLASFLPASILDVVIGHCKDQGSKPSSSGYPIDLSQLSGSDNFSDSGRALTDTTQSAFKNFPSLVPSVLRQAVCIALKYSNTDNRKERRRRYVCK